MNKEIEKKYLLRDNLKTYTTPEFFFQYNALESFIDVIKEKGVFIKQGYLSIKQGLDLAKSLKLNVDFVPAQARVRQKGNEFFFALKSEGLEERIELESKISQELFDNLYSFTEGKRVEKIRYIQNIEGLDYEFDFYLDRDLVVVEIEVKDKKDLSRILALGKDITLDKNYKNEELAKWATD